MAKHQHLMYLLDYREPVIDGGQGATLRDTAGRTYTDLFADTGTASLGYGGEEHNAALVRLLDAPVHAPNMYPHRERDKAARRVIEASKLENAKVFFSNSGAEAVEAAIKIARLFHHNKNTGRHEIWSAAGGFHGRTLATLAAGDGPPYHRAGFHPLPDGFHHFSEPEDIPETAAAVMLAPVMGNNDARPYSDDWWLRLKKRLERIDATLIFDEVQTGSGRTGAFLYAHHLSRLGITPDIVSLAKGLGMGCPVGATIGRGEYADVLQPRTHWSTFGGNPMSCTFINFFLDWLLEDAGDVTRFDEILSKGRFMMERMRTWDWVKDVRGAGMMVAGDVEFNAPAFALECEKQGVILGVFRPTLLKLTPPLNIDVDQLDRAMTVMEQVHYDMKMRGALMPL